MALTLREAPTMESELVSSDGIRIVEASPEHLSGAANVLARAFQDEPYLDWIIDLSAPRTRQRLAAFMVMTLAHVYARGDTILIGLEGDKVVGIAALEGLRPGRRVSRRSQLRSILAHTPDLLVLARHLRWRTLPAAGRATKLPRRLKVDHQLLEWLAVDPDHQGMGLGQMLLDRLREIEERALLPTGIYTYTIGEGNWAFYQKCGYSLIARVEASPAFVAYHVVLPIGDQTW
jgi:GNAT superfamily N-acetyltransferase